MKKQMLLVAISCPILLACSTFDPAPGIPERGGALRYECNADGLETLVGLKVTAEIGADALTKSGGKKLRWVPPHTAITMDYRQDRLNIEYDEERVITRVTCG
ncbi:MAG: I78 family peptidase inhibitor [Parasphingorhabdus sp.]|uniref:I78 family peptidase inhibitor n=1 Tax=Parasphingorhabdus sp. TaxID=2709688 RepID=UPI0030027136